MYWYLFGWYFVLGSILGWLIEVVYAFIKTKHFQNRSSFIYGPWGCAYGIGVCLLYTLLNNINTQNILIIFFVAFIGCSIAEYIMSWGMELIFNFCVWDYSKRPLNINGRICLLYSVFWGILGIIWIKIIKVFLDIIIHLIPYHIGIILLKIILFYLIIDALISLLAVLRSNQRQHHLKSKTKLNKWLDYKYNDTYLKKVYPQMFEYRKEVKK